MAIPTNRQDFIDYCFRKLGNPVIQVNVAMEQADDRVDEALIRFHERHYNATEEVFLLLRITEEDARRGAFNLSRDIVSVTDVFLPTPNAGLFSVEYQLQLENLFSTSLVSNYGDLTYYYMTQANITLINRMFSPVRQYTYNPITNRLVIAGGLKNTGNIAGGVVVRAYKKIYGDEEDMHVGLDYETEKHREVSHDRSSHEHGKLVENVWGDRWLQNYTTALIKRQWGTNLSKYQSVQLLGGVQMNGAQITAEADAEIIKLEDELYNTYELPPIFIMG